MGLLAGRGVSALLSVAVLAGTGVAWATKASYDARIGKVPALDQESPDIQDPELQTGVANFLLVGSDSRSGANAPGEPEIGARSDVVMLAHIPKDRTRVVFVSFPRDLEIARPECRGWESAGLQYRDETRPGAAYAKLNTAYAFGGPKCLTQVIQQLTGIRINHFAAVEFNGFRNMVDAVGGVTMHFDNPIIDREQGAVIPRAGRHSLDGERALRLVRSRYVRGDPTSDYGRMKRQQQFIGALLGKAMTKDVLLDVGKLTDFVGAFTDSTFGEGIGVDELLELTLSMKTSDPSRLVFRTVPTTGGANERGNEVLRTSAAAELCDALIDNQELPPEG